MSLNQPIRLVLLIETGGSARARFRMRISATSTSHPAGTRLSPNLAPNLDNVFDFELVLAEHFRGDHTLRFAGAVPQNDEGSLAEDTEPVDPALEQNLRGDHVGNVFDEETPRSRRCHANPQKEILSTHGLRTYHPASGCWPALDSRGVVALTSRSPWACSISSFRFERTSQRGLSSS